MSSTEKRNKASIYCYKRNRNRGRKRGRSSYLIELRPLFLLHPDDSQEVTRYDAADNPIERIDALKHSTVTKKGGKVTVYACPFPARSYGLACSGRARGEHQVTVLGQWLP